MAAPSPTPSPALSPADDRAGSSIGEAQPARPGRTARVAHMEVVTARSCSTCSPRARQPLPSRAALTAVLASENGSLTSGEEPIEWLLLATPPVHSVDDAQLVRRGYSQRWRIEEFHRLWKTGACNVEDRQLRDRQAMIRWATILASVAMRLLRLTYLARTQPATPATVELTRPEIDAVVASSNRKRSP